MSRSINYASSPLLTSKTPVWRSKFIVAVIAIGFLGLIGRAAYIQVINNNFFKRQGEVRFVRTLDLPANRGKILDQKRFDSCLKRAGTQCLGNSRRCRN